MRSTIIAAVAFLSGCAPTLMQGNAAGGTIDRHYSATPAKALQMAQAECAKYGKDARVMGLNLIDNTQRYECVAR